MKNISFKGSELLGLEYKPLFPYFKDNPNSFKIINADFVTTEDGTGIVHLAPAFGEDDHNICSQEGIELVCPVDQSGNFTSEVHDLDYDLLGKSTTMSIVGKQVFEGNDDIIKYLKGNNMWIHTETYRHQYPFCWRTDTPLIYKKISSWFVKVTAIKDRMIELNQDINWIPGHVKDGIFGKWLENTRDWSISRNRFWGCPIPVWQSTDPQYPRTDVYGSIKELERDFGSYYEEQNGKKLEIKTLHRPFIDELTRPNPDDPTGKSMMVRVTDVLDCWFESGSMPYASIHYPFEYKVSGQVVRSAEENQRWFKEHFPADFIVEYMAQTRGWFYTLMVLGTALFDSNPFKNCICHGVVLDEKSQKLSKRWRNYPDPLEVLETYGSDALRFAMCRSQVMKGGEINVDIKAKFIKEVSRLILLNIWNAFSFLKSYMECDGLLKVKDKEKFFISYSQNGIMDRYMLAKTGDVIKKIESSLDQYYLPEAFAAVEDFIENTNNWYIRRCKKRFWSSLKFYGEDAERVKVMIDEAEKKSSEYLTNLANKIQSTDVSDSEMGFWEHIECVVAGIVASGEERKFRVQDLEDNGIMLIDQNKMDAYKTLYTSFYEFSKAAAPMMPCLMEKIFLDLIGDSGNFDSDS